MRLRRLAEDRDYRLTKAGGQVATKKQDPYYTNPKTASKTGQAPKPRPYKPPTPPKTPK